MKLINSLAPPFIPLLIQSVTAIYLLFTSPVASANKPGNITKEEMSMIPRYCPDTQGFGYGDAYSNTSPRAKGWVALMGKDFWNIHHYCWAQINIYRSQKMNTPRQIKRALLEEVLVDLRYVVSNSDSGFILLPEVLSKMGDVELRLTESWVPNTNNTERQSHINNANSALARARSIKPDYWPAYFHWGEFLIRMGKHAEAKELIREGLEYSPTSRSLVEQYKKLGGNPNEITPKTQAKPLAAEEDISPSPNGPSAPAPTAGSSDNTQ